MNMPSSAPSAKPAMYDDRAVAPLVFFAMMWAIVANGMRSVGGGGNGVSIVEFQFAVA